MSDQPLGRDRLGRLVYEGDYVWPHRPDDPYWIPVWREEDGRVAFDEGFGLAEHTTWPEFVTIDLAASPKRTNYQRYFADIAEENEVEEYTELLCDLYFASGNKCWTRAGRRRCPWHEWGGECGVGRFVDWLHQEATV